MAFRAFGQKNLGGFSPGDVCLILGKSEGGGRENIDQGKLSGFLAILPFAPIIIQLVELDGRALINEEHPHNTSIINFYAHYFENAFLPKQKVGGNCNFKKGNFQIFQKASKRQETLMLLQKIN